MTSTEIEFQARLLGAGWDQLISMEYEHFRQRLWTNKRKNAWKKGKDLRLPSSIEMLKCIFCQKAYPWPEDSTQESLERRTRTWDLMVGHLSNRHKDKFVELLERGVLRKYGPSECGQELLENLKLVLPKLPKMLRR